ncbi:MAG: hypothetical protein WCE50_19740, partial [Candidatus Acidiferrum sp.]
MELAVDAAQSRQLPEFLERFAGRAARMVNATWGGVAVFRGRETDLYSSGESEETISPGLKSWIISTARDSRAATEIRPLPSAETPAREGGAISMCAVFVPISASDG